VSASRHFHMALPLIHPALIARAFQAARLNPPAALTLKEDDLANLSADLRSRQLDLILVPSIPTTESYGHRHIDTEPVHYLPGAPAGEPFNDEPIELSELSRTATIDTLLDAITAQGDDNHP
jgi:DNA-binding transcriptional LysR family regulator